MLDIHSPKRHNSHPMGKTITVAEAAKILGKQTRTVHQHIQKGWLTAYKHGRDWVLDEREVRKFVPPKPGPVPKKKRKTKES